MKKSIFWIIIFILVLVVVTMIAILDDRKNLSQVCLRDTCFTVELAITPEEKTRGLIFRDNLNPDKGMLFVFEKEGEYSFWMKNVLIPLDIIWINEKEVVVFISENSQPCREASCDSIMPSEKAKYVLEINGGISEKIGLEAGDRVILNIR